MVGINGNNKDKVIFNNGTSSLGMPSRYVHTDHFCGPNSPVNFNLPDTPSKSLLYDVPVSFTFDHYPGKHYPTEKMRAKDFRYNPLVANDTVLYRSGSSNVMRFPLENLRKYGPAYNMEDLKFNSWLEVNRGDKAVSYVQPQKEIQEYIEGQETRAHFCPDTPLNKFVTPYIYEGPLGKYGAAISMLQNRKDSIRNALFSSTHETFYNPDTFDFSEFLAGKFDNPRNVGAVGIQNLGPDYSARLYFDDKSSTLIFDSASYEKAKARAEALGLHGREAIEGIIRSDLYHELVHNAHPGMSEREAEILVGKTLNEFYTRKAKGNAGTYKGRLYKILAAVERLYAESWEKGGNKKSKKGSKARNLESRLRGLEAKARSLGLSDSEIEEYMASDLEKELEETGESDLEREINEADREYSGTKDKEYNTEEKGSNKDYNNKESDERNSEDYEEADEETTEAD